ncbi:HAMP domain-containing protein [Phototrophicus methaneseepsis]|uniref:Circadian input-output histidine kinase CikA n=1 Tax=Phototrophicus methaneseepsis TaxID=2710758 RepID=A0A7S8EAD2_9CHLR|nr:hybrid sensor histidine kinase/response regulator [Phototrophicus methaneseepsis]QPC83289.1 HAMP domain-containing protein [Phototrophicus methaneseepsis]
MLNSLRTRLTLTFVSLTIIPLIIVGVLITSRGYNALQNDAVDLQHELAQRTAINLEAFFNERETELTTLTQVYGLDTLPEDTQEDILLTLLSEQTAYYQLALVGANAMETIRVTRGDVITDSDLISRADDAIFQRAVQTHDITYSSVYFNEEARDRLITLAVPIENLYTGDVGNVLIAEVRFQNVSDAILRELDLNEGDDVYVVNNRGVILAHSDPSLVIRETTFDLPESDGRTTGLSGTDVILATDTVDLSNEGLTVVAETSFDNATVLANDVFRISVLITVTTLIVASAIVIWTVNRLVNPIINMSHAAEAIQGGDLTARVTEEGNDEIALLGRTFNQMTAQLQKTLEGLQSNIEQLEYSNQERAQLIKDLQTAKRIADENSRLKSEFLATMSHELRTPLNAIEGFTSIMLGGMGVELSARAEDMVKRVSANSKRLLHLINDFLDLSRIESGRLELVSTPLSPARLAQKWQEEVGILAEEKGIEFDVTISPDLPVMILGDEDALSKVAVNMLSNAFKFTHEGRVALDLQRMGDEWMIVVSDTGIGIPPHAREYIFDEFRQVDGSSKRLYGGTGLGLSLVQKLSRAMGGHVSLESEVGAGSTFTVVLPLQVPEATPQGTAEGATA